MSSPVKPPSFSIFKLSTWYSSRAETAERAHVQRLQSARTKQQQSTGFFLLFFGTASAPRASAPPKRTKSVPPKLWRGSKRALELAERLRKGGDEPEG